MSLRELAFALIIFGTGPATAQEQIPNHNVGDPNERLCETLTPTGSRITTKRFCGTRAEWAEKKREDRAVTEQLQRNVCARRTGSGC